MRAINYDEPEFWREIEEGVARLLGGDIIADPERRLLSTLSLEQQHLFMDYEQACLAHQGAMIKTAVNFLQLN